MVSYLGSNADLRCCSLDDDGDMQVDNGHV